MTCSGSPTGQKRHSGPTPVKARAGSDSADEVFDCREDFVEGAFSAQGREHTGRLQALYFIFILRLPGSCLESFEDPSDPAVSSSAWYTWSCDTNFVQLVVLFCFCVLPETQPDRGVSKSVLSTTTLGWSPLTHSCCSLGFSFSSASWREKLERNGLGL